MECEEIGTLAARYEAIQGGVGDGVGDAAAVLVEWADLSVDGGMELVFGHDG